MSRIDRLWASLDRELMISCGSAEAEMIRSRIVVETVIEKQATSEPNEPTWSAPAIRAAAATWSAEGCHKLALLLRCASR
jgi:hypothetical protein